MSLHQIMDATPIISWDEKAFGDYIGSGSNGAYLIAKDTDKYELWYHSGVINKTERHKFINYESVIDKINELEGIQNVKPTQE